MKHKQLFLVILAFFLTVSCIFLLQSSTVIGAMCGAFLSVVGAYTALDLKAIIKATGQLPAGSYKEAERWKYFIGVVLLSVLFLVCILKQNISGIDLELSYGFLGPGTIGIITVIISGMKLNKSATLQGPKKE